LIFIYFSIISEQKIEVLNKHAGRGSVTLLGGYFTPPFLQRTTDAYPKLTCNSVTETLPLLMIWIIRFPDALSQKIYKNLMLFDQSGIPVLLQKLLIFKIELRQRIKELFVPMNMESEILIVFYWFSICLGLSFSVFMGERIRFYVESGCFNRMQTRLRFLRSSSIVLLTKEADQLQVVDPISQSCEIVDQEKDISI
jgi:hypothetical protein